MRFFSPIIKSDLVKNISILASGTILAQLIPIALQPILRRQFTPEDYGAYSVYLSLVGILVIAASFKYELAIVLPKKEKEAANILFLSLFLSFSFNLLLLLIILFWKEQIGLFLNLTETYANFLFFVPLGTFLYNSYQSINYWLIREKKFLIISKNKIIRRATEGTTQLSFSLFQNSIGLLIGDIIGHIANIIAGIYQSLKNGLKIKYFSIVKLKYVAKKYSEYPKINLIPSIMSASSYLLPAILINKFFSTTYAGYFDLSKLVLSIPLALIATSVSNVLLQKIAEKFNNKKSLLNDLLPVVFIILIIAILEIVVIYFFGEYLFKIVFGETNTFSGKISEILVWSYAFNFLTASFGSIFIAMKKIKLQSIWQVLYFLAILSLLLFKNYDFIPFLKIYVTIEIVSYVAIIILVVKIVINYEKSLGSNDT